VSHNYKYVTHLLPLNEKGMSEKEILELYEGGRGIKGIMKTLRVSHDKVRSTLAKHNIPIRPPEHYSPIRDWRTIKRHYSREGKGIRVVTLPAKFIEEAGFRRDSRLMGKWEVQGKDLILHLREVGRESLLSRVKRRVLGSRGKLEEDAMRWVSVRLPDNLVKRLDQLVKEGRFRSRGQAIREYVVQGLLRLEKSKAEGGYVRSPHLMLSHGYGR